MPHVTDDTDYGRTLHVAEQAAEWLERLKTADAHTRVQYLEWLRESPLHVREMLLATAWDRVLNDLDRGARRTDSLDSSSSKKSVTVSLHSKRRQTRSRAPLWIWSLSGAVGAVLCAALALSLMSGHRSYETQRGQQRAVELPDGSTVFLNTLTRIQADYTERTRALQLAQGQATFNVQHDQERPFTVHAGAAIIRALGTRFDVDYSDRAVIVTVVEGRVSVTTPTQISEVNGGESLRLDPITQAQTRSRIDVSEALAWQQRRLTFHDRPLGEIVAEFNRYNELQLVVADPAVAQRTYTGVFNASDPESFVSSLESDRTLTIERERRSIAIRSARSH